MHKLRRSKAYLRLLPFITDIPNCARSAWRLLRDRLVPVHLKTMVVLALLYVGSPFDIIPDFFLPGLGYIDDMTLLLFMGYYLIRGSPPEVVDERITAIGGRFQRKFRQWWSSVQHPSARFPPRS